MGILTGQLGVCQRCRIGSLFGVVTKEPVELVAGH